MNDKDDKVERSRRAGHHNTPAPRPRSSKRRGRSVPGSVAVDLGTLGTQSASPDTFENVVRLCAAPEQDGISVENSGSGYGAVLRRRGEELARSPLDMLDAREDLQDYQLTALFPQHAFCYAGPLVVEEARAFVGPAALRADLVEGGLALDAIYEPTLYTAFDGDIDLCLDDGSSYRAGFREWRRNVANLDAYPPNYRRVVQITLPEPLAAYREDPMLLLLLGRLVCELIGAYVASGGEVSTVQNARPFTNVFAGGEAPEPATAPILFGRKTNDVYAAGPESALLPG